MNLGYYDSTSSVTANLANLNAANIKTGVIIGRNGGNSSNSIIGTFTSDATAGNYDICSGKTAYVKGNKITGAYESIYLQRNSGSSDCSTRTLKISCPFDPSYIAIVFNSPAYANNRVVACWGAKDSIVYHTKTTISLARTQITSNVSRYWSYSNGVITINSPSSSYLWSNNNYRVFAFK